VSSEVLAYEALRHRWRMHGLGEEVAVALGENKDIVRHFLEDVLVGGNMQVADEVLAEDVVNVDPLIYHQPGAGKEGIKEGIRLIHEAFPDISIDLKELLAEDDRVMAQFVLSGTNTGPYRGLAQPTGKHGSMRTIFVFRLRDGTIAEISGVADRMEFLTQLGILPDIG
jgi:steroid delta-isomerase-like uncharacterized protein